jgi:hypothetical protein
MKSTLTRVLAAAGVVALLAVGVPDGAGAALLARPTAKVDVHQVVAGAQQPFALTVSNPIGAGRITSVRVTASTGLFVIAAPIDLAGWTGVVENGFLTFTAARGGGIAGGVSKVFGFVADALRPAHDENAAWSVSTSIDLGTPSRYTAADPAVKGGLGTRVRTLEVLDITVSAPEELVGDRDLYVTAGQDNITTAVRVANAGSASQSTTVSLTDDDGGTSTDVVDIAPGEIATVPLALLVGDAVGHGKAVASAAAGASVAATRFRAYVAQRALEITSVAGAPQWTAAPGIATRFEVPFLATGDGAAPVTLDPAASHLVLADGAIDFGLRRASVIGFASYTQSLETERSTVPASLADGTYGGTLHLEGVDPHGATFVADVAIADGALEIDSDVPTAELEITPEGPAGRDGDDVLFGGTITDGGEPCEHCGVTSSILRAFDADGHVTGEVPVDEVATEDDGPLSGAEGYENENGTITGRVTVAEWPAGTVAARWIGEVYDGTGLTSAASSPLMDVDNTPPAILSANAGDVRAITVALSEPVTPPLGADFAPGDWSCTGSTVQRATLGGIGDLVVLALANDLDRNAEPTCTYSPRVPATDRMGYPLPAGSVVATDGMSPLEPTIDEVEGRAADDGFYVNTSTPTLSIDGVERGDTIAVYEITDGGDVLLASGTASSATIELTTSSLGTLDRHLDVYAQATDPAGGSSGWSSVRLVLDFTAPSLDAATIVRAAGSRDVRIMFGEPMVGPAAANDWAAYTGTQPYTVSAAVDEGGVVTLTVGDARFQPQTMTIDGIRYDVFAADGSTRLTDRAGNVLADSFRTF